MINYGILTGREATQAEIDRLAQSLYSEAGAGPDLTITAVRRQDYGRDIETVSHQVLVEVTDGLAVQAMCRAWGSAAPTIDGSHRSSSDRSPGGPSFR